MKWRIQKLCAESTIRALTKYFEFSKKLILKRSSANQDEAIIKLHFSPRINQLIMN